MNKEEIDVLLAGIYLDALAIAEKIMTVPVSEGSKTIAMYAAGTIVTEYCKMQLKESCTNEEEHQNLVEILNAIDSYLGETMKEFSEYKAKARKK